MYTFIFIFGSQKVQQFLWPRWGLEHGKKLLELLESERFVSRPLLIHAFSIGGYTFAQLLIHVSQDTQKYQLLTKRIKGQVYDSLVVGSVENMAIGKFSIYIIYPSHSLLISVIYQHTGLIQNYLVVQEQMENKEGCGCWISGLATPGLFFSGEQFLGANE